MRLCSIGWEENEFENHFQLAVPSYHSPPGRQRPTDYRTLWSHAASLKIALYMISPVAPSLSLPRKKRILPKILIFLVLLLVLGCLGIGSWFYRTAHSSLAQLDGLIAVAGLNAPVSVVRDAQGVPHLTAASLEDLFAAQGYITAQDRLWQMDMSRRYAGGELAEILPATRPQAPAKS